MNISREVRWTVADLNSRYMYMQCTIADKSTYMCTEHNENCIVCTCSFIALIWMYMVHVGLYHLQLLLTFAITETWSRD